MKVDEAVSCDMCAKWQHCLCYTGITEDICNAANRDQAEFVCGPCQHELQPPIYTTTYIYCVSGMSMERLSWLGVLSLNFFRFMCLN